jgi:hypothetical protein
VYTLGGLTLLMFACRFFLFHLYESPKFLLSRGRQEDAVATVHAIAYKNAAKTWLTVEVLNEIGGDPDIDPSQALSRTEVIKRALSKFSSHRIGPLFATKRLGLTSTLHLFPSRSLRAALLSYTSLACRLPDKDSSGDSVVLLGNYRYGLPSLQCLSAPVSQSHWRLWGPHPGQRHLPQLCNHVHRWRAWLYHRLLHCRH